MKAKLLSDQGTRTYAVVFEKGEEAAAGLVTFARGHEVYAGQITAIGGFSDMVLGYFDGQRKEYRKIPIQEQVEVLSLLGDIALRKGAPEVHAHVVVGKADGTAWGGHLLEAHVWPTLEVIVVEPPAFMRREMDEETGLALIRL